MNSRTKGSGVPTCTLTLKSVFLTKREIRFRVNRILEDASDPFIKKVVCCHNDGGVAVGRRLLTRGRFCIVKEKCTVGEYFQI